MIRKTPSAMAVLRPFRLLIRTAERTAICTAKAAIPPRDPDRKIVLAITAPAMAATSLRGPRAKRVSEKTSGIGASISMRPA